MHAPSVADLFENAVRALVKSRLARGHVEVRITFPPAALNGGSAALNRALLEEYLEAFRQARPNSTIWTPEPDLNAALRIPGMFGEVSDCLELPAGAEAAMLDALGAALDELNQFRAREGAEIAEEMFGHNARVARRGGRDGKDPGRRAGRFSKPARRAPEGPAQGRADRSAKAGPGGGHCWPIAATSARNWPG